MKIVHVVGARPNFVKIASVLRACRGHAGMESLLVHTGQHYTPSMSKSFFEDLEIPEPDINLEVGSGSHAVQTAEIMRRFEPVVLEHRPQAILVVGDVNSTVACALVATKLGVKVVHVEAGLRSFDRTMPEEVNRVLTDAISDLLFVTEASAVENLRREGIDGAKVHLVGNVMIDTLERHRQKAARSRVLSDLGLSAGAYAVVTLHRPSNVDDPATFAGILAALERIQEEMTVVFPVHPRAQKLFQACGLWERIQGMRNIRTTEPLGYLDFLKLMSEARVVVTDSGGIQEETTILGVPCLTVRENTERPVTLTEGTNRLVGTSTARILTGFRSAMSEKVEPNRPVFWDGRASERIADVLSRWSV